MKEDSIAVAYPGLPVVFAEGYKVASGRRVSLHGHASFALTDLSESVRTVTKVEKTGSGVEFILNGRGLEGSRSEGMGNIVGEMLSKAGAGLGVRVESENYGIATGSSDSGAAALAVALSDLLELGLSEGELCEVGRLGSETAYRSILGGLSGYDVSGEAVSVSKIKTAAELSEIIAFGVSFNVPRHTADELHQKVLGHLEYSKRAAVADERISEIKAFADNGNFTGLLDVMESDARDVHRMFDEVGLNVIKPPMRKLCSAVESIRRRGIKCYWNVAGGSQVYVFTVTRYAEAVEGELDELGYRPTRMKVAGPAAVIQY